MNKFNRTDDYKLEEIFEAMITPTQKDSKETVKTLLDSNIGSKVYVRSKYFSMLGILEKGDKFDYSLSMDVGFGHFNLDDVTHVFTDDNNPYAFTQEEYLSIELK